MAWYTKEFLKKIPKTDLHVHLDGSLRLSTLIELARDARVKLPSTSEAGLKELVFKNKYADLNEYLQGFAYTSGSMQSPEALERVAYELFYDNAEEGVRYIEVRFAPQLHISEKMDFKTVMESVDRGFKRAKAELNKNLKADEPPYEYGLIACAMRFFDEHFSRYFADLFRVHAFSTPIEVIRIASLELAKAVARLREESDIQIVAFDLAGSEYGYPASDHSESYDHIHRHFINKTVHAGEAFGPESIFQAVTKLHADRIGHGLHLFNKEMIRHVSVENQDRYIENLVNYLAEHRTTIEICLTSNRQTSGHLDDIAKHSLAKMLEHRLSVSLCTDNRLVSDTTVVKEYELALDNFKIGPKELKNIVLYGFKRSFYYHNYVEKRNYVRKVLDYYDVLARQYDVAASRGQD